MENIEANLLKKRIDQWELQIEQNLGKIAASPQTAQQPIEDIQSALALLKAFGTMLSDSQCKRLEKIEATAEQMCKANAQLNGLMTGVMRSLHEQTAASRAIAQANNAQHSNRVRFSDQVTIHPIPMPNTGQRVNRQRSAKRSSRQQTNPALLSGRKKLFNKLVKFLRRLFRIRPKQIDTVTATGPVGPVTVKKASSVPIPKLVTITNVLVDIMEQGIGNSGPAYRGNEGIFRVPAPHQLLNPLEQQVIELADTLEGADLEAAVRKLIDEQANDNTIVILKDVLPGLLKRVVNGVAENDSRPGQEELAEIKEQLAPLHQLLIHVIQDEGPLLDNPTTLGAAWYPIQAFDFDFTGVTGPQRS